MNRSHVVTRRIKNSRRLVPGAAVGGCRFGKARAHRRNRRRCGEWCRDLIIAANSSADALAEVEAEGFDVALFTERDIT